MQAMKDFYNSVAEQASAAMKEAPNYIIPPICTFTAGMLVGTACGIPASPAVVITVVVVQFGFNLLSNKIIDKKIPQANWNDRVTAWNASSLIQGKVVQMVVSSIFPGIIPPYIGLVAFLAITRAISLIIHAQLNKYSGLNLPLR